MKRILMPIDGSANGDIALEYCIYIANKLNTTIAGLHILDINLLQGPMLTDISGAVGMSPYDGFFDAIETSLSEKADFILKNFRDRCLKACVEADIKKIIGKIDETIIEEAQSTDLIVMARKGEHFHLKEGGLLGSVAQSVIRNSGKPVMITPEKFVEIESMGIAYDGSPAAIKALELSLKISKLATWPLTAIIITQDPEKSAKLNLQIEETAELRETECEVIILPGKEGDEILNFINEGAVELIVMGAFGHKRWREFLLGSTTTHIINKSPIPVLLTH